MTLAEATAGFLNYIRQTPSTVTPQLQSLPYTVATQLLISYYSADSPLSDVTAASLHDFLARWYLERACSSKLNVSESSDHNLTTDSRPVSLKLGETDQLPAPQELLASMADFFKWTDKNTGDELTSRCSQTVTELSETLSQAIEITRLLSSWIQERRGAFAFPEFLTSFEEGGRSQYDIDTPGNIGALEGYFRIIRVEGSLVEAEDLISEERVLPITFPSEVAALLDRPYVINLELLRTKEGWQIASCGFAYPPGTEV
jgi:hypothetical protein